jgi:hypothetical protein
VDLNRDARVRRLLLPPASRTPSSDMDTRSTSSRPSWNPSRGVVDSN